MSGGGRSEVIRRRVTSIAGISVVAVFATVFVIPLVALLAVADLARAKWRLPLVRLAAFGICWAWLELTGVTLAGLLWLGGRGRDTAVHFRLQAWWADKLMAALQLTCGLRFDIRGAEVLRPGPTVLLPRHASIADALLTAWTVTDAVGMRPRVVMKRELLVDPCLDIVGNRLPNCFVDRGADDSTAELAMIGAMGDGLGRGDVAVIFPEGTRASPAKRARAMERLRELDPERAALVDVLHHVLPPRPSGTASLLDATPGTDVVLAWHTGFEGLDTFAGIIAALGRPTTTVRMRFRRISRSDVPDPHEAGFTRWLDDCWLAVDDEVGQLLHDFRS